MRDCGCPTYIFPNHNDHCLKLRSDWTDFDSESEEERYQQALFEFAKRSGDTSIVAGNAASKGKVYDSELGRVIDATTTITTYRLCTHASSPFELSDGTTVYVSAWLDRLHRTLKPDFAVYLDDAWKMSGIFGTMFLEWPDYDLPESTLRELLSVARYIHSLATIGKRVEIGCLGAHGRTGTLLAILDLVARNQLDVGDDVRAIEHVRTNHCKKAIETEEQEWLVEAMACHILGLEIPKKPEKWWGKGVNNTWVKSSSGSWHHVDDLKEQMEGEEAETTTDDDNLTDWIRYDGGNWREIVAWADKASDGGPAPIWQEASQLFMETKYGLEVAHVGDWIVRSSSGEIYPIGYTPEDEENEEEGCDRCGTQDSLTCLADCDCKCHEYNNVVNNQEEF